MAFQQRARRVTALPRWSLAFAVMALVAMLLSLGSALAGASFSGGPGSPAVTAAGELAARNERITFFEGRAAADPIDYVSRNILAVQYLQRARETGDLSEYGRAEAAAEASLSILPRDNAGGLIALASVQLSRHAFAEAKETAAAVIALRPLDATGYSLRSDANAALGRYEEAAADLQKMVQVQPGLPAFSRLAHLAFLQGDLVNAKDFWRQALAKDDGLPLENRAWVQVQLGELHRSVGELAQAEKSYRAALTTFPDYVHALAGLAYVRATQGRWQDAIALFESVQRRLPQPLHLAALGDVYRKAGRTAEAEQQYELVEAVDSLYRSNGINTDLALARFYTDHDRGLERALDMAQQTYAAAPGVYAADALAWALYKAGRYQEAGTLSDEAMRLGTPEPAFYFHAGMIHYALGEDAPAAALLDKALKLNPRFSLLQADFARQTLARIKGARP